MDRTIELHKSSGRCIILLISIILTLSLALTSCKEDATQVGETGAENGTNAYADDAVNSTAADADMRVVDSEISDDPAAVFVQDITAMMGSGDALAAEGLSLQAQSLYGFSGASVSSLRYAVENILWHIGADETLAQLTEGSGIVGWDSIAAVCYASPYPYYFEGLLYHILGNEESAEQAYINAMLNGMYPEDGLNFYYLRDMETAELYALRDEMRLLEEEIYGKYEPDGALLPRDAMNFDPAYLTIAAQEAVEGEDYAMAYSYSRAALLNAPFDAELYGNAAMSAMLCGDFAGATRYIDEGLLWDAGNEKLGKIYGLLLDAVEVQ